MEKNFEKSPENKRKNQHLPTILLSAIGESVALELESDFLDKPEKKGMLARQRRLGHQLLHALSPEIKEKIYVFIEGKLDPSFERELYVSDLVSDIQQEAAIKVKAGELSMEILIEILSPWIIFQMNRLNVWRGEFYEARQEAYLAVYDTLKDFDPAKGNFSHYYTFFIKSRIANNVFRKRNLFRLKEMWEYESLELPEDPDELSPALEVPDDFDMEEAYLAGALPSKLVEMAPLLKQGDLHLLEQYYFEGKFLKEIAENEYLSLERIRQKIEEIRKKIFAHFMFDGMVEEEELEDLEEYLTRKGLFTPLTPTQLLEMKSLEERKKRFGEATECFMRYRNFLRTIPQKADFIVKEQTAGFGVHPDIKGKQVVLVHVNEARRLIRNELFWPKDDEVIVSSISPDVDGAFCLPYSDLISSRRVR